MTHQHDIWTAVIMSCSEDTQLYKGKRVRLQVYAINRSANRVAGERNA